MVGRWNREGGGVKITPEEQAEFDNLCDDILAMAAALYDKVGQLDQYADNADAFSKDQTPEKENQIGLAVALNVIRGFIADTGSTSFYTISLVLFGIS